MSRGRKIMLMAASAVGIVSTPLLWLLDNPDTGQLVGATVQAATGIIGLVWALLQTTTPTAPQQPQDVALDTGIASADGGGTANSGVRRPGGTGSGSATAERTGKATAHGPDSSAISGIDYS